MPSFQYRAYDARGSLAQGHVEAISAQAATDALWAQGLTAFRLQGAGQEGVRWWQRELFAGGARRSDLAAFTREFATLVGAGIPLDDSLRILADQATSSGIRALVADLRQDVLNGMTLSDALQKRPKVFPADYISIIRAGEAAGAIGQVLEELAALLQRREEVRAKLRSALVYPAILLGLSAISLAIIIGVLIPSIAPVFAQGGKPLPPAIQVFLTLQAHWLDLVIGLATAAAAVTWAARLASSRSSLRLLLDRGKLAAPVAGRLLLQQETARMARTLGTLLRAGVPLLQATTSACNGMVNCHLAGGLERAIALLRDGASLHRALQSEMVLPAVALRMISIGEEAGRLDQMLLTIAAMFEQQTQRSIDRLMTLLTPALTMGVAVLVGSLIMAVMNAVLSINELAVR